MSSLGECLRDKVRGKRLRDVALFRGIYSLVARLFLRKYGFIVSSNPHKPDIFFWQYQKNPSLLLKLLSDSYDPLVYPVMDNLDENDVFIDVGSFDGLFSLFASRKLRKSQVFSFEPNPYMYTKLSGNIRRNGIKNIRAFNLAVGQRNSQVDFFIDVEKMMASSLSELNAISNRIKKRMIECVTLDKFLLDDGRVDRVDFVKIDTEGFEFYVLKGMKKIMESFRPKMLLEVHLQAYKNAGVQLDDFWALLKSHGYEFYFADELTGSLRKEELNYLMDRTLEAYKEDKSQEEVKRFFPYYFNLNLLLL